MVVFVLGAYAVGESNASAPPPAHQTILQHEVKFMVVANGGSNPAFKLTTIGVEPAKARSSPSTEGPRTYDLLFTIAPAETGIKRLPQ